MLYSARPNLYTHHQLFQILRYMGEGGKVGSKVGGPRPFFVSEFTLVLKLFEHNFLDFHLICEVGGKVGGPRPFLVFEFILIPELYVQNFVIVHAFVEEISAEMHEADTLCF